MANSNATKQQLSEILLGIMPHIEPGQLTDDADLSSVGLQSIDAPRLIMQLESKFGVSFSMEDMQPQNFRSIDSIATLLEQKKS